MNKFIKCWVFIICLLFILLILFTDKVHAESIYNIWLENKVTNQTISNLELSSANIQQDMTFNNVNWTQNYDFFNGSITIINNTQRINIINGDSNIQCNSEGNHHFYETSDTYYQDGSTSSTSTSSYNYYCNNFTSSNDNSYVSNIENMPSVEIYLYFDTYTWVQCPMDTNGNFTCPLVYNNVYRKNIQKLRIRLHKKTIVNTYVYVQLQNYAYITTDIQQETKTIIQNQSTQQHQDNQTIIQQQQDINNSITSDNITGNNSTTTINNLGGTFQTQQDFLLNLIKLPYTFFSALSNTIQNQCNSLTIGTIFDYELVMPCINLNNLLGDVWTLIIDVIFAGVIASAFVRRVTKYIREVCTLDTNALNTGGVKIW